MTHSGGYTTSWGRGEPPFDRAAEGTIAGVRQHLGLEQQYRPPARALTGPERAEAEAEAKKEGNVCVFCLGLHPLPSTVGCPRIATFEMNGDGVLVKGTFWPGTDWAEGRLTFAVDAFEAEESTGEKEAGDGNGS